MSVVSGVLTTGLGIFSSILLAAPALSSHTPNLKPDFEAIDGYVVSQMENLRIPGLVLGVVHEDRIEHLRGFGVADSDGRRVTPQTPFVIGSLTKSFTAMAILQLVDAGKIDVDSPVQRYLPWFSVVNAGGTATITVRDLLNHTSGLSTLTSQRFSVDEDDSPTALESRVRALRTERLVRAPGKGYEYSGANYATLGLIVQTVSNESFESYVAQHIFGPLAMYHSFASESAALRDGLATGHVYVFGQPLAIHLPFNRGSIAQGYLMASGEDMTHYLVAQLRQGRYDGAAVISPGRIADMQRPAVRAGADATSYGMGWKIGSFGGVPAIWHDGSVFNYHSHMVLLPLEGNWGVVMLKNIYSGPDEDRLTEVMEGVVDLLVGRPPPPPRPNRGLLVAYLAVVGVAALQVFFVHRSMKRFRVWRTSREGRPRGWLRVTWWVILPSMLGVAWCVAIVVILPRPFAMSVPALARRIPDFGYTLLFSAGLAGAWAIARAALCIRALSAK